MTDLLKIRVALQRLAMRGARSLRSHLGLESTIYVDQRVAEYREYWKAAALALEAEFRDLSSSIWEVRKHAVRTRIGHYVTELDNPVTLRMAGDKALLYRLAAEADVPCPDHTLVGLSSVEDAVDFLRRVGRPVVVKPVRDTSSGLGITAFVEDRSSLISALVRASLFGPEVLVEEAVPGESYRLLFLDGELVHAVKRTGIWLSGDGSRTVAELARGEAVRLDSVARATLRAQGMGLGSVPAAGTRVLLSGLPPGERRTTELRTVYDQEITDRVAPEMVREVRPVVEAVGATFAGVDVITMDPTRPLRESGGRFIELNTTPGIHHHEVPGSEGGARRIAEVVLRRLLQQHPLSGQGTFDSPLHNQPQRKHL